MMSLARRLLALVKIKVADLGMPQRQAFATAIPKMVAA